jgi:hypothetical protein
MKNRVTYFSEFDGAFGYEYANIQNRLPLLLENQNNLMLEDILELTEINKYLQSPRVEDTDSISIIKIKEVVRRWFSNTTDEDLLTQIKETKLSANYKNVLWEQLVLLKINDSVLEKIVRLYDGNRIVFPLRQAKVVKKFTDLCCDILVQNPENVSIVLNEDKNRINIPTVFDRTIRSAFFMAYVQSVDPNLNYLELISFDKETDLDVRLAAKKKYQNKINKHFEENAETILRNETKVGIDMSMADDKIFVGNNESTNGVFTTTIRYNGKILSALIDWPTILNNFIYIFKFVDKFGLLTITPKNEQGGFFDRFFENHKKGWFMDESVLRENSTVYEITFITYYRFLQKKGIHLEDILEWFFSKYLADNFGIKGLSIKLPKANDREEIKALLAVTQLHRIVRMYSLLDLDFNFDRNLIDNYSSTPPFSKLSSVISKKYAVIKDKVMKTAEFDLFSDQGLMPSTEALQFGEMVIRNLVVKSQLDDYQTKILEKLIDDKILICNGDEIQFTSNELYLLLRMDFYNGLIPYSRMIYKFKNHPILDELICNNKIDFVSTLLTKKEADVFDYYFSDRFPNGKGLRNKYAHGSFGSLTSEEHSGNYMIILMFIVFIIIKINDDLDELDHQEK